MATTVGTENSAEKLIENCLLLEHDAIAAYESVIERLQSDEYRAQIQSFHQDHLGHLEALEGFASEHGVTPPSEGDMKQILTTGKVAMADLVGNDGAILRAMSTNEADTVSAYQQAAENPALPNGMRSMVDSALADERRHKAWMENTAQSD